MPADPQSRPRRVLLIGAFANGNIGDMYQADAVASALHAVDPTLEIFSASPSKRATPYPAALHTPLPAATVRDADQLNAFDLILVGGGGLLAARHAPLSEEGWARRIDTTICGLSLGCAGTAPAESRAFIERCARFSVRDQFSASAVAPFRPDAEIVLDPIFLGDLPALAPRPPQTTRGILWIPAKLVPNTLGFYTRLVRDSYDPRADMIASLNEETDRSSGFDEMFGPTTRYLQHVEQLRAAFGARTFGVSERYHGCILALRMGIPCLGLVLRSDIVTSKISELYRQLGLQRALVRDIEDLNRNRMNKLARESFDFEAIERFIAAERGKLHAFLRSCLDAAQQDTGQRASGIAHI